LDSLQQLLTLDKEEGFDLSFLAQIHPILQQELVTLRPAETLTSNEPLSEQSKKLQEQLDKNFQLLYSLQLSQNERSNHTPSEKEQNLATQVCQSLTELSSGIAPSLLFSNFSSLSSSQALEQ